MTLSSVELDERESHRTIIPANLSQTTLENDAFLCLLRSFPTCDSILLFDSVSRETRVSSLMKKMTEESYSYDESNKKEGKEERKNNGAKEKKLKIYLQDA